MKFDLSVVATKLWDAVLDVVGFGMDLDGRCSRRTGQLCGAAGNSVEKDDSVGKAQVIGDQPDQDVATRDSWCATDVPWEYRVKNGEMTITLPGGVPMTFCWCPATTSEAWKNISGGDDFLGMGSPETEAERDNDEKQHRVALTQGFWMGKYEVTQRQWCAVMGSNPSDFKGEDRPVEEVSWDDSQAFVGKINAAGQVRVSLPTEAQWEYACRAGTTTPFSFGSTLNGDKANCDGNYPYGTTVKGKYREETASVGSYAPNAWGLYDMHGNVWEWCLDWYGEDYYGQSPKEDPTGPSSGDYRVLRGGGWYSFAQDCRSALRFRRGPGCRSSYLGLRLVCSAGSRR